MFSKLGYFISAFFIFGCTTTGSYIERKSLAAKSTTCDPVVFMPGENIKKDFEILGTFSVQEAGLSVRCGWDDTLQKNKEKACSVGADAIQFINVVTPSINSTCYTSNANFIHFKNK